MKHLFIQSRIKKRGVLFGIALFLMGIDHSFAQCTIGLQFRDQNKQKITNQDLKITYNSTENQLFIDDSGQVEMHLISCDSNFIFRITTVSYLPLDTILNTHKESHFVLTLLENSIQLDTIVLTHDHTVETKIEHVQAVISQQNIQNTSALFDQFTAVNTSSKSSTVQKPVLRQFHSQRLTILEHKLPLRDHNWGLDHGLETGLSHISDISYSSDAQGIYADYGSLSLNNAVFFEPNTSAIGIDYNYVNRKKALHCSLKKEFSNHYFLFATDLEKSENIRLNTDKYRFLGSNYSLKEEQLSNTGRDKYFVSLDYKFKEKLSLGVYNNFVRTGFFPGAVGIPGAYQLINETLLQLPHQRFNHLKIHAHYSPKIASNKSFASDIAYQNNVRKELEKAGFHGYNPTTTDSLGVGFLFSNIDWLNVYAVHLDSTWCIKAEHSLNLGKNKIEGFDFIIPQYQQVENRLSLSLEYLASKKYDFGAVLSGEQKMLVIERYEIEVYQNKVLLGTIEPSIGSKKSFVNLDFLLLSNQRWNKKWKSKISMGTEARSPEINELAAFGLHHGSYRFEKGNLSLQNERSINAQFALEYENKWFSFKNALYGYRFSNFLYLTPSNRFATAAIKGNLVALPTTGQLYEYKQTKASLHGLESDVAIKGKKIHYDLGVFYTKSYNIDADLPLPFTAQSSVNNMLVYVFEPIKDEKINSKLSLNWMYYLAQNRVDRNELKTPKGNTLNAYYECSFWTKKSKTTLNLGMENILNKNYYKHLSEYRILNMPEPARNFFVRLTTIF